MNLSQLLSLRSFDDEWRPLSNLKSRGVNPADLPFLLDGGYIVMRECGTPGYQITQRGREILQADAHAEPKSGSGQV